MQKTQSATPLDAVLVERNGSGGSDVWLRRNIHTLDHSDEGGLQVMWEADETHGVVETPVTCQDVESQFDAYWQRFEDAGKPAHELIGDVRHELATHEDAIVELDMLVNSSPTTMEDLVEAVIELADIVAGLAKGGE